MLKRVLLDGGLLKVSFVGDFSDHLNAFPDCGAGDVALEIETFDTPIPGEKAVEIRAIVMWREVPE